MHFLKVGLLFAASTVSRLLAGLIVIKIIAVYIGADGLGQLGQFMSLVIIVTTLAGGGIATGVTKFVSQYKANELELNRHLGAASLVTLAASTLLGCVLLLGAPRIAVALLKMPEYAGVIRAFAVIQFFIAGSNLLMGLVNGHQRVRAFAIINVLSVVLGASGMVVGSALYGIKGAMYGLMWMPACTVFLLLPWYRHGLGFAWSRLRPMWDSASVRKLMGFALMLFTSAMTIQMSQVVIRNIIEGHGGWTQVGYWQAAVKISDAYLQFITVVLANYFLPRLAATTSAAEIKFEVAGAYRIALPLLLVMGGSIYLLRDFVIPVVFSQRFMPVREFFPGQLVGDFFKVAAYIVGYVAVARASTRLYIGAEVFQAGLLVGLSYWFVGRYGAVGATYAYALTYIVYATVAYSIFRMYLRRAK